MINQSHILNLNDNSFKNKRISNHMNKSTRENLTIRMSPELRQELQIQAIRERRSLSDLLEDGAALYLRSLQPTEKSA
jgi:predicted HicB family RNase H-like nuclease